MQSRLTQFALFYRGRKIHQGHLMEVQDIWKERIRDYRSSGKVTSAYNPMDLIMLPVGAPERRSA